MFAFLSNFFLEKQIRLFAPVLLGNCTIQKPYLLERAGITDGTVWMLAIPYFTSSCLQAPRNLSAYAVSRDYHIFFEELFSELLPLLQERYPNEVFAAFADHSPIWEAEAAAKAGLGVIGKNRLLITKPYSSYVFLGEVITTAKPTERIPVYPVRTCENCGHCQKICPMMQAGSVCLSALTQKKGALSDAEQEMLIKHGMVWGCDKCQEVCPHTHRAMQTGSIFSPIAFFEEQALPFLTNRMLQDMPEEAFARRAYAWRGRKTIERNLLLTESGKYKE